MKKTLLLMMMLFLAAAGLYAQPKPGKEPTKEMLREMQEFKLKFLVKELGLTDGVKDRFVETYSKMEEEKRNVFCKARKYELKIRNDKNASEADYEAASRAMTEAKAKDAEIERKYDAIFAEFLTKKQIYKLKEAEEKFRQKMRELHQRKHKKRKNNVKVSVLPPDSCAYSCS